MNEENEKLRELVFMAIGEASMCWSEVPSGVFESTRAKKIGDKLMEGISRHQSNPIDPDYAEFKAWKANGGKAKECENCHDTGFIDDIDWTGAVESLPCPACHGKALAPKPEAKTGNVLTALDKSGLIDKLTDSITYLCPEVDCDTIGDKIEEAVFACLPATLEPLACLASRKGWFVVDQYICKGGETSMGFRPMGKEGFAHVVHAPTYAACEQLARTWLEEQKEREV